MKPKHPTRRLLFLLPILALLLLTRPRPSAPESETTPEVLPPDAFSPLATEPIPLVRGGTEITPVQPIHRRTRQVEVDPSREWVVGERLVVDLFEDVRLEAVVRDIETPGPGRRVLYGDLVGVPGDLILARCEEALVGVFSTPTLGMYQIRPVGGGRHVAIELDPAALPPCESNDLALAPQPKHPAALEALRGRDALLRLMAEEAASVPISGSVFSGEGQQGGSSEGMSFTRVDIMVVYTTNAKNAAGGAAGMTALIDASLARANSALINSQVALRFHLVRAEEVNYSETNNNSTDLTNLQTGTGAFSSVPSWRNASGADLVTLFCTNLGGLAYLYHGNAAWGYSLVGIGNAEGTFTHEIGHNFALQHDRENVSNTPLYPYAYGWRFTPAGAPELRTIMAYAPGRQVPYFSNPDVTYMGAPTGVPVGQPNESNNAQVFRNTMATVAAFRSPTGNAPPSVSLTSPDYSTLLYALDAVNLSATASDSDGTISQLRFYRLKSDNNYGYSGVYSVLLGSDNSAPYSFTEAEGPAGFWTYGVVAVDNQGACSADTVSLVIAPHYRKTFLPLPPGKTLAEIGGINESGRVVGYGHTGSTTASDTQAVYWENGTVYTLNPLPGDTGAVALAVGNDGIIYGASRGTSTRAVRWVNSSNPENISEIITGWTAEQAIGVDELGRIYLQAGTAYRRFNNPGSTTPGLNQRWVKVGANGRFSAGHDWNGSAWGAMRWNESGTQLQPVSGYASSWGRATNRSGAVLGFSNTNLSGWSDSTNRLTFWPAGSTTPQDLGTLGSDGGVAYGLNDFNHAVGYGYDPVDGQSAFVWKGQGPLLNLNRVTLPHPSFLRRAYAINNRGQIAGTGYEGSTQIVFLLDPLPGLDHNNWLGRYFTPAELENAALTADTASPAGDGIPNLAKRAYGLNPRVPYVPSANGPLPTLVAGTDPHLLIRYHRLRYPRDIQYHPEATDSLTANNWSFAPLAVRQVEVINDDYEAVTLQSVAPLSAIERFFFNLRITR